MPKSIVKDIMSTELIIVRDDDPLTSFEAYFKSRKIHHLLVVNDTDELTGIISSEDAARAMSWITKDKILAEHIMTKKPETILENITLDQARIHFLEKHFRALPVVNDTQNLVGIITLYDLVSVAKFT